MNRAICLLIIFVSLFLAGCIPSRRESFRPEQGSPLKKIGLLKIYNPTAYDSVDFAGPEGVKKLISIALGGAVGGLVGSAITDQSRTELFQKLMESENYDFSKKLTQHVTEEMNNAGYYLEDISVSRKDSKSLVYNYDPYSTEVDAYLDIVGIFVGYNCKSVMVSRKYKPRIIVHANLIRANDKRLLYSELINYGEKSTSDCVYFPIDEKYQFEAFADLLNEKTTFIEGMNIGIEKIAKQIVHDLSREER